MSVLRMVVNWSARWQKEYNVPKGYLLLRYQPKYRINVGKALQKLDQWQEDKAAQIEGGDIEEALRDIDCTLEIHYEKRTLPANRLMWALYEIEANEQNGGRKGEGMLKPEDIYRGDMETFAPTLDVKIPDVKLEFLQRNYAMVKVMGKEGVDVLARVYVTSSHWNTKEMHDHLEMLFDRLSTAGIDLHKSADISHYWFEWRQKLNDEKYIMHDQEYTVEEYRELVKNCEACGAPVWHEDVGSSIAHIKAVGMGGPRERKYYGSELMHLCDTCHAAYDNGKGRDVFLEQWPHLRYKVEADLKHEVKEAT